LTPPSIKICPLFNEAKKGDFFTLLPPVASNVNFWAIIFLKASLIEASTKFEILKIFHFKNFSLL